MSAVLSALFAFAPAGGQADGKVMGAFVVQMVLIVGIVYFLLIRPKVQQEKKHKDRLSQLKTKDEIVTVGGIIGEVIHIREMSKEAGNKLDDRVTIKSAESRLVIERGRIAKILTASTTAPPSGNAST